MTRNGMDELSRTVGRIEEKTDAASLRLDRMETKIDRLDEAITLDQTDLAKLKAKGAGILIGVSLASGFVGSKLSALAHLLGRVAG